MKTWHETKIADVTNPIAGKVSYDGSLFWASDASRQYVSSDGLAWTTRTLPNGVQLHAVARSKTGTYVGFDRGSSQFFRSADGLAWAPAKVSPAAGADLYRMVYGYGKPSAECPL